MRKLYIVKSERDFNKIIKQGKLNKNKYFVTYNMKNDKPYDRFGISVPKKIGNAVLRNKYKRKIRSIIDIYRKDCNNSKDYIIILRNKGLNLEFSEMKDSLINLIKEGERHEK